MMKSSTVKRILGKILLVYKISSNGQFYIAIIIKFWEQHLTIQVTNIVFAAVGSQDTNTHNYLWLLASCATENAAGIIPIYNVLRSRCKIDLRCAAKSGKMRTKNSILQLGEYYNYLSSISGSRPWQLFSQVIRMWFFKVCGISLRPSTWQNKVKILGFSAAKRLTFRLQRTTRAVKNFWGSRKNLWPKFK
jgi:hypothetical protein